MPLEKVADREIAMCGRLAPHPRSDGEGENQRSETCRSIPPPAAQAFGKSERRRADGGAGADVGSEKRREDQSRAEAATRDKEVGSPGATANPQTEGDEQRR